MVKSGMAEKPFDSHALRVSYDTGTLETVAADPLTQFTTWINEAIAINLKEPNAMVLATVDESGQPSTRSVLLKEVDARGFSFFTNYASTKSQQLDANPRAALTFPWYVMHRQINVVGRIERVDREEANEYWKTRPRGSQVGAWASRQSTVLDGREELEQRWAHFEEQFEGQDVPLPEFWGGWRVIPSSIEFWQGRVSRLHDRFRYTNVGGGALDHADDWRIERLSP